MNLPLLTSTWDEVEDRAPDVAFIIIALLIAFALFRAIFPRVARAAMMRGAHPPDDEMAKRADTIIAVVDRTAGIGVILIGAITIMREVGVDITAIVTGLGITGLALALGAQALVRDGINGMFLLAEDQYRRGDVIRVADVTGTVEDITLRRTIIRDEDGVVHSVPNGSIGVVSNYTRDYAQVNVPVRVSYGQDLERVRIVAEAVGRDLVSDARFGGLITEAPRLRAVESVGDEGVAVTITARTRPAARWEVAGELRRRLAEAFLREGVQVPYAGLNAQPPATRRDEQT
jgi:small conductance mechanosensitive channel